ncbi:MAG: DMT family transporter [Hyphomicrobiaceae bacterium]
MQRPDRNGGLPVHRPKIESSKIMGPTIDRNVLIGSGAMILSVLCFTSLDAINKVLVQSYSAFFLSWGRSAVQLVLLLALIPLIGASTMMRTSRPLLQAARGACIAGVSLCVTLAVRHYPLTETYVIGFLTPFLATVIAAVVLAERATALQWTLITLGFTGVLVALQPTSPDLAWTILFPIGFAVINAVYFVLTRLGGRTDGPWAQLFYVGLFATLALSVLLPWTWQTPTPAAGALILCAGALGTLGHMFLIKAFASAPTAVVAPMVYFQIIWSSAIGYAVFGDVPAATTWIGAAVVVVAGVALIRTQAR